MTTKEIKDRLKEIKGTKKDFEVAHSLEDKLWEDFIGYIAGNYSNLGRKAQLVLTSRDIKFQRPCA